MLDKFNKETNICDFVAFGTPYIRDEAGVSIGIVKASGNDYIQVVYFDYNNKPKIREFKTSDFLHFNRFDVPSGLMVKLWVTAFGSGD